jgi:hypothetical protein
VAFVANWSAESGSATAPADLIDLVTGARMAAGARIVLTPRAAHIFQMTEVAHQVA